MTWSRRGLIGAMLAALLAGCGAAPEESPAGEAPPSPGPDAVRMAAVGDSLTAADTPDFPEGELGPETWARHVVGEDVALVGGWARWGATTGEMVAAVDPEEADVLVMIGGTNDVFQGEDRAATLDNLREVARTVGAEEVVLSAVTPVDSSPELAPDLNADLVELAEEEGWHWVDAAEPVRDGDRFAPGAAYDGLHLTEEGAALMGERIRAAVLAAAG